MGSDEVFVGLAMRLDPFGKPMRVLRVLAGMKGPAKVSTIDRCDTPKGVSDDGGYHHALAALVKRGLAVREGVAGEYVWTITQNGLDLLTRPWGERVHNGE